MIKTDSIEALKQIINIIDIVSNYVELHKSGSNYKARCPFHEEKTPSMVVSEQKGLYHCFGCGASGDAIKFVMEYEKLNYKEALQKIAAFYHFSLQFTHGREAFSNDSLVKINAFFMNSLFHHSPTNHYITSRGISQESKEKFQLGYAPSNQEVMTFIRNNSAIDPQEALKLGVLGEDSKSGTKHLYSRFANRLIFPIHSPQGKIVGFGGRAMSQNNPAKYLNSPQTILFNKSRLLYGYHLAKENIYAKRQIIITEGYIDVILLHQAGFTNAVATLGTALGKDHLPLIAKGEPQVLLAYDGDKAGKISALKASYLLAHKEGGVVLFPEGLDPADMVAQNRIQTLHELFASPTPFIQFILEEIAAAHDLLNPLQKEKAYIQSMQFLKTLSPILQTEYKPILAQLLNIESKIIPTYAPKPSKKTPQSKHDILTLGLILYLMQNQQQIDYLLDYVDSELFCGYEEEFELLKKGEFDHPKLARIRLSPLPSLSDERLDEQIRALLFVYYNKILKQIHQRKDLDPDKKAFLFRDIRTKIKQLQEGEMIFYESFSTL